MKKRARKTNCVTNKIYWANSFGSNGDGKTISTKAIQQAIDACAKAGGGIVAFKPGNYLTGALFLKSNVNLRVDENVSLLSSQEEKDYPEIPTRVASIEMPWLAALINIIDANNVKISGAKQIFSASGLPQKMIQTVKFININVQGSEAGSIEHAKNWTMQNAKLLTATSENVKITNSENVEAPQTLK